MPDLLEWPLRAFGLFWILGGVLTFQQARQSGMLDETLNALQPASPEDPLVTRYMYVSSVLTTLSGLLLALASPWAAPAVGILVIAQLIYFGVQHRRYAAALDDEAREDATVTSQARNVFAVSVVVGVLSGLVFGVA